MKWCLLVGIMSLMLSPAAAAKYDVAAFVWPAYQPEPRWSELGIFMDGKGEWQNLYEAEKRFPDDYQGVKPLWGYENEADPVVVARKIDAATAAATSRTDSPRATPSWRSRAARRARARASSCRRVRATPRGRTAS